MLSNADTPPNAGFPYMARKGIRNYSNAGKSHADAFGTGQRRLVLGICRVFCADFAASAAALEVKIWRFHQIGGLFGGAYIDISNVFMYRASISPILSPDLWNQRYGKPLLPRVLSADLSESPKLRSFRRAAFLEDPATLEYACH